MASYSAVVFDLGGVLLDWNPRYLYRKLFDGDEAAMEQFLAQVCTPSWHAAHDLGYSIFQACSELAERDPAQADLIRAWGQRSEEMVAGPIAGSVAILADLKQRGVACYALSNMEAETFPLRLRRFAFMRWFDGHVISGLEGMAKPDPRIYRLLLDRYRLRPGTRCSSTTGPTISRPPRPSGCARSSSSLRLSCAPSWNPSGCWRPADVEMHCSFEMYCSYGLHGGYVLHRINPTELPAGPVRYPGGGPGTARTRLDRWTSPG